MIVDSIIFQLSLIIISAAILGTLFLYGKQPIIIAYIAAGVLIGPGGYQLIKHTEQVQQFSHIGIILLLFLIGLNLQPSKIPRLIKTTSALTVGTAIVFAVASLGFALLMQFTVDSALIFSAAMMFSSTVIALKLIPTTTLHHKRKGELMTGVLLIQDILAILVILFISGDQAQSTLAVFFILLAKFIGLWLLSVIGVKYIMTPLLMKFDVVQEYTFVATLAWCLLWAEGAYLLGLSYELGAFVAGLSIASCRVALIIAEHLKPLREFFLILFFFAVGAELNFNIELNLLLAAIAFGVLIVPLKALVFQKAFRWSGESPEISRELAVRLSQSSEFSLLVAFSALSMGLLTKDSAMILQIATITSFVVSTYWVVLKYPTTISSNARLNQD
ncbi:MAG: cation:proton antiporter [Gammaproteobacteria bacterium]|nr:cation:proton antiporter [Gammaproteobacteria bacterium]